MARWSRKVFRCGGLAVMALAVLVLVGCAQQRIRDDADSMLRNGQYEQAVAQLEAGLRKHPDSTMLLGTLLLAKSRALVNLLGQAASQKATGRLDEAEQTLKRALPFDVDGVRVPALLAEVDTQRRQQAAVAEAEALEAAGQEDSAVRVVAAALKDGPRHSGLLELQRRLEFKARQAQLREGRLSLAESRRISLDFRDANLRSVLDVVTRNSGVNFILDKEIRPDVRVTVYLRSAKVEEAIDLIAGTNQLAKKVVDDKTILIYPNTSEKQREYQEQIVRVFYLANADAKGAAGFLRSMLKIREPFVDEKSNLLAIRESLENVQLAERLVSLYDSTDPEVLLDVEVIEVRTSRLTELGIKFPDSFSLSPLSPSGSSSGLTLGNVQSINANRIGLSVPDLLLNLKREVGDVNTLANPRIRARNKEKAKIMIGDRVPIVTATVATGGFVSDSVSYVDVGLKLEVEPTVYIDDDVVIRLGLEVSTLGNAIRTTSGSIAYQIGTRNASTALRLRDGETQLLAGLIDKADRTTASRIPGVGDLPVMGRFFSSQLDDSSRTELVLAITPHILRNVRRPPASETELWVGTEAQPKLSRLGLPNRPGANVAESLSVTKDFGPAASSLAEAEMRPPTLRWEGPGTIKAGEAFIASLYLNSGMGLRGGPLQLSFDREKLAVLEVAEGQYFKQGGSVSSFTQSVDPKTGRINVGLLSPKAAGIRGEGSVLVLRLKALGAGKAEVVLHAFEPFIVSGEQQPVQMPQPYAVEVQEP